jgi:hypothetical protein
MPRSSNNNFDPDWFGGPWRPQTEEQVANMDPETRKLWDHAVAENVFGVGYKRDANGPRRAAVAYPI